MRPLAGEGAPACLALVPVTFAGRGPAHEQFADLVGTEVTAVLVNDTRVVAGHRPAGRAVTNVVRTVRQEGVEHLGRAETIEHVDAHDLAPALADMRGQGFARR